MARLTPFLGRITVLRFARAVGAIGLLVGGGAHLQQYSVAHFSVVPTIGPLFLLDFIAATALALVLLVPIGASPGRWRQLVDTAAAVGGIGVSAGALAALLISEHTPLFGFMEYGYRREIVIALAAEGVAVVALALVLVCTSVRRGRVRAQGYPPARGPIAVPKAAPSATRARDRDHGRGLAARRRDDGQARHAGAQPKGKAATRVHHVHDRHAQAERQGPADPHT